jgi:hypothetical protein
MVGGLTNDDERGEDAGVSEDVETSRDDVYFRSPDDGRLIPNLSRLPEERWLEALRPLNRSGRSRAANTVGMDKIRDAIALIGQLALEDDAARVRAFAAPPVQLPSGDPPPTGARRQVNFRLGPGEHARLIEAARVFGMRPNVLARLLTVRGVDRALREARRDA